MKRIAIIIGFLIAGSIFFWLFPLFHVVPVDQLKAKRQQAAFNAAEFANDFWVRRLLPSLETAVDAGTVLGAIRDDPQQARRQFGRSVGVSRAYFYFLRGSGTIVSVDDKTVGLSIHDEQDQPDLVLLTGLLFGNTIRDATGLLSASDFPNSQQFNEVSTELNRIIETQVIPSLKEQAKIGGQVHFVGCARVLNESQDLRPLKIIPLEVKFQ